ncbi:MAG: NADH-quinone oxidoreductase subunit N [Vicinamibacterales bacterium]
MFSNSFDAVIPVICVTLAGLVVMLAESFRRKDERMPLGGLAIIGLVGAAAATILLWNRNATSFGVVTADNFALFVNMVIIVVGILTVVVSSQTVERDGLPAGEYYATLLFAIVGMMLMAQATDLLLVFLALETMSIAVYVLTGLRRDQLQSTEAAFKYFLLGAFASSFFLYGVAFIYGVTGSTGLDRVGSAIAAQSMSGNFMILLGVGLMLVGFAFKIAAVPFHMWSPDAYEGAPTVITGFMSTGVKAAAIAAFARVFLSALEPMITDWAPVVWAIAAATMVVGTVVGVAQTSLKRMLAYSSIAHGGYLLLGILAGNDVGKAAILYYLAAYALTNLGAFGIMALLGSRERANDDLRDYAGLAKSHPALAALMTFFLLSLGGFPPTAGFIAKWYVFSAAVGAGYYGLAIIGVLSSVVSVFFYLRIVVMMYMSERDARPVPGPIAGVAMAGTAVSLAGVLYLGVLPARASTGRRRPCRRSSSHEGHEGEARRARREGTKSTKGHGGTKRCPGDEAVCEQTRCRVPRKPRVFLLLTRSSCSSGSPHST